MVAAARVSIFANWLKELKMKIFAVEKITDLLLDLSRNNTAGYHRHIFHPPIFLKMPFKSTKYSFFINCLFFPKVKILWFFCKKTQLRWKDTLKNIIIDTFIDFEKNSSICFSKKPIFVGFEKCFYFSRLVGQIRCSVVMKKFQGWTFFITTLQRISTTFEHFQFASKCKNYKNVSVEKMIFPP